VEEVKQGTCRKLLGWSNWSFLISSVWRINWDYAT